MGSFLGVVFAGIETGGGKILSWIFQAVATTELITKASIITKATRTTFTPAGRTNHFLMLPVNDLVKEVNTKNETPFREK
ncbi:hypothetical protein GCM10027275_44960 [Rhabdobacter roseus]